MADLGLALSARPAYGDGNDDALVVAILYLKATPMPVSTSDPQPSPATPTRLPVDLFMDRVVHAVRRHETRAREPFCYTIDATADFTGLPVRLLRSLCRSGELHAFKLSGRWLIHRDEFNRLLSPDVTLRCRAARQHILLRNLQQLAAMLRQHEASHIMHVLLHDLRRAIMFRQAGACYEDAEGMVWHRAAWRIRDGLVDRDLLEDALRLLRTIIELGMELLRD
jgi:hypothetical protein